MKAFSLSISGLIIRFFLMMGVVILAGFVGQWWIASLALPIFLSALLGFGKSSQKEEKKGGNAKLSSIEPKKQAV